MSIAAEVDRGDGHPRPVPLSLGRGAAPRGTARRRRWARCARGRGGSPPPARPRAITAQRDTPQLRRGDELDARALGLVHLVDRGPAAIAHAGSPGGSGSLLVVPHEPAPCPGEQTHHYKHRRRQDPHRGGTGTAERAGAVCAQASVRGGGGRARRCCAGQGGARSRRPRCPPPTSLRPGRRPFPHGERIVLRRTRPATRHETRP
jgi:hypothetical protein